MFQPSSRCFLGHWLPRKTAHSSCVRKRAKRRKKQDCDVMTKCFKWTRSGKSRRTRWLRARVCVAMTSIKSSGSPRCFAFWLLQRVPFVSQRRHACAYGCAHRSLAGLNWSKYHSCKKERKKKERTSRIRMVLVVVRGKKGGGWKCLMWSPVYYNYLLYAPLSASHWAFLPQRTQHLESFAVDCDFFFKLWNEHTLRNWWERYSEFLWGLRKGSNTTKA